MDLIYHITTDRDWAAAQASGAVVADSLHSEGFIHCSRQSQLLAVAERFFATEDSLLVLAIDTAGVAPILVNEGPADVNDPFAVDVFPHVYGPIPTSAVIAAARLMRDAGGHFGWPAELPKT